MKKTVKKKQRKVVKRSPLKPRGVSKVLLLAIVALILAGAGGFYVFGQKTGQDGSSALPFAKKPLNASCKYNDPELCKYINNLPLPTTYTITSTAKVGNMSIDSVYSISGSDKYHMIGKQNGKEISNTISIGDTTYTLDYTDNKWWKKTAQPDDPSEETVKEIKDQYSLDDKAVEDKTTYKFIAKEACGSLTCFKYEMAYEGLSAQSFIWFDDKDYLMRKMNVVTKNSGTSEAVYSYDPVVINAPSPVKEGASNSYNSEPYKQMSEEEIEKTMQQFKEQNAQDSAPDAPQNDAPEY